jgi:hypothetical protein
MNKIKIIHLYTQYSLIEVNKYNTIYRHIVSNNGWLSLKYWIDYFKYMY